MTELIGIALGWVVYGIVHSWLAGAAIKQAVAERWPGFSPAYRLVYNGLAVILLLPPVWLTWRYSGAPLWHWPIWVAWPATLLALAGFAWSMVWYDGMDFIGLRQWRLGRQGQANNEKLSLSPLHRHVRHPWYALGLLLMWTRDLNAAWLVTTLVVSGYLIVGSRLEERKLIAIYGEAYRRYRERVPGLLPWPGRCLSVSEAETLLAESEKGQPTSR